MVKSARFRGVSLSEFAGSNPVSRTINSFCFQQTLKVARPLVNSNKRGNRKMITGFVKKLMFVNKFNMLDGHIDMLDSPYIMLDASMLLGLQETDETRMYEVAKTASEKSMKNIVQHAKVYRKMKITIMENLAKISGKITGSDEGAIKTLQDLFNVYGLGALEIISLKNAEKTALLKVKNSSLARAYLEKNKKSSPFPCCTMTAGILAGIFSFIFKKDVDCIETKCLAQSQSNQDCLFEVK